jgi:hypothetical protein
MIRRLLALIVIVWVLGFAVFVVLLPLPADLTATDAIVVPTGSQGRIARGVELIAKRRAKRMLITVNWHWLKTCRFARWPAASIWVAKRATPGRMPMKRQPGSGATNTRACGW